MGGNVLCGDMVCAFLRAYCYPINLFFHIDYPLLNFDLSGSSYHATKESATAPAQRKNAAARTIRPGRLLHYKTNILWNGLLVVDGAHIGDELDHLVGVAALVVVPGDDLHEGVGQSDAGLLVEDGGMYLIHI